MKTPHDVTIGTMHDADAMRAAEVLQQEVWGFEPMEVVPQHVLVTAARHGGLALGAWRDGRLLAHSFAFRGVDHDGTPVLCSHMLGVTPEARGLGLGVALKWAQRDEALAMGVTRILWTFDPLEHGNARLNTRILGGVTNRYLENVYGEMRDALNAGLPSDRLEVVWNLHEDHVEQRAAAYAAGERIDLPAEQGVLLDGGTPDGQLADPDDAVMVRVSAPRDIQAIRRDDPGLAAAWRSHLRTALQTLFERGYLLTSAGVEGDHATLTLTRADARQA